MYVFREILNCKPGKVREMVGKFQAMSTVLKEMGHEPVRLLTDVAGDPFWTVVVEVQVESIDDFFAVEKKLMTNETLAKVMGNYHELVSTGRREIYRLES